MQTNYEAEQLSIYDLDSWCGRMFPEPSPAERPKEKTSDASSRRSSELKSVVFQSLDLTPGHGNLLGESYWELISPWRGDASMLNTGVSPREENGSSLSQILQDDPPERYYLTRRACLGILRRASERGKELPEKLKRALEIQAGLVQPDGRPTKLEAYHINQRDEGIDLHGVSGALMATSNMQMQTFVTQPDEGDIEGFDGYNGDLTGSVAATLGVNCGMSTGRNGLIRPIAFAANQRDEVRDLHDVAGALTAQPGMKQQTFVAAGFCAESSKNARGIGYQEECSPTLKAVEKGPSVMCLNDQGGQVMDCTENITGTLRAQMHSHQPLILESNQEHARIRTDGISPTLPASMGMGGGYVPMLFENHGIDARYTGPHTVSPTLSARGGTGGNNLPLVEQEPVFCITGNIIDRQPRNGGNGIGYQKDIAYTLTATDHHAVFSRQRVDVFSENEVVSTESARQHKDATDLVVQPYQETVGTLVRSDHKGISSQYVSDDKCIVENHNLIRRLTPLECERLQGFPDGWTNIPGASDSARYKALGNSVAIPCVEYVMRGIAIVLLSDRRRRVWIVIVIQPIDIRSARI